MEVIPYRMCLWLGSSLYPPPSMWPELQKILCAIMHKKATIDQLDYLLDHHSAAFYRWEELNADEEDGEFAFPSNEVESENLIGGILSCNASRRWQRLILTSKHSLLPSGFDSKQIKEALKFGLRTIRSLDQIKLRDAETTHIVLDILRHQYHVDQIDNAVAMPKEEDDQLIKSRNTQQLLYRMRYLLKYNICTDPRILKYYNIYAGAHPNDYASTTVLDKFKNPVSKDFNLGKDGAFACDPKDGRDHQYTILIGNFFHRTNEFDKRAFESNAGAALKEKGLAYTLVLNEIDFIRELKRKDINGHEYDAALFISSDATDHYLRYGNNDSSFWNELADTCEEYVAKGFGLFIFADNSPFLDHANVVIERLFSFSLAGNNEGQEILEFQKGDYISHLITTGLQTIYEGHTVCYPDNRYNASINECKVLASGSDNGKSPVVLFAEARDHRGRVVIDTGFTKLWLEWRKAGTDRYINNAVVWLLGIDWRMNNHFPLHGPISFRSAKPSSTKLLTTPTVKPIYNDFIILADGSGSVARQEFAQMKDFAISLARKLKIGEKSNQDRITCIQFDSRARVTSTSMFNTVDAFSYHVQSIVQTQGGTSFYYALDAGRQLFQLNDRPLCNKILILQTDGEDGGPDTSSLVHTLKSMGITIIAIAVGRNANTYALSLITGDQSKVISIDDYSHLKRYIDTIAKTCAAG